jgi:hypothetical protein
MYNSFLSFFAFLFVFCAGPLSGYAGDADTTAAPQIVADKSLDFAPYILPSDHPLYGAVARIFPNDTVIKDDKALESAGFDILYKRKRNDLRVVSHPKVRGYIFKLYTIEEMPKYHNGMKRLIQRCKGSIELQKIIDENHIRHFTVPKKWLYALPAKVFHRGQLYVVIAQDMRLRSREASIKAWKTKITKSHLEELYILLKAGYGSMAVDQNIAYTKNKTFTFIDLEYPPRKFDLRRIHRFLSENMWHEWEKMI